MFTLLAQISPDSATVSQLDNPASAFSLSGLTLSTFLTGGGLNLFTLIFFIVGVLFFFGLVTAAFGYIFSEGNPDKLMKASGRIVNSLVGLGITLASFVIIRLIAAVIGLDPIVPF